MTHNFRCAPLTMTNGGGVLPGGAALLPPIQDLEYHGHGHL